MPSGALPFRIVGGARAIAIEDLDRYLDSLPKMTGKVALRRVNLGRTVHCCEMAGIQIAA
jgi:hypothetical protein